MSILVTYSDIVINDGVSADVALNMGVSMNLDIGTKPKAAQSQLRACGVYPCKKPAGCHLAGEGDVSLVLIT